jgi:amino acid adenylation domain-containing protein
MTEHGPVDGIAIIGMAGRFPDAPDVDTLWSNLCAGVESVRPSSDEHLRAVGAPTSDPDFVNASAAMDDIEAFDASFFGMSRREAEVTDPQHRVLLETAWATLEHAGYDPDIPGKRVSIFGGVAMNQYFRRNLISNPDLMARIGDTPLLLATEREYAIMRVAYKLGLRGPAVPVTTACSTSGVAIHLAFQSLLAGESDLALAGGAYIKLPTRSGYLYQEGGILSSDGHVRVFDADARGTVMGSGVAMVALKRVEDALADDDTIYAVIRGTAINNDGAARVTFTAPGVIGQTEVIADALAVSGVDPATIGMLEAHGTGTSLGDPIEVAALTQAYRQHTDARQYCAIGSIKSNVGHLDAAAGVAGVIKAALSLYHERIPPSINFRTPNPQIDFASSPFFVNTELREWARGTEPRRAGVSSFGFGGTNAHIVLEEAPVRTTGPLAEHRPHRILAISARTPEALERQAEALAAHLEAHPATDLADAAWTLAVGRVRMPHRRAVVAPDASTAAALLRQPEPGATASRVNPATSAEVGFLFTGQGAQYLGMGAGLYRTEPVFREAFEECARLAGPIEGHDLVELLYGDHAGPDRAAERLLRTAVGQPAILALQVALSRLWASWGVRPVAMVGHSVGEIAAAHLGGLFSLEDAMRLAVIRGRLMQDMPAGAMTAVMAEEAVVLPLLDSDTSLAAVNAPEQCVASGPPASIEALEGRLTSMEVSFRRLATERAFHSPMMEPAVEPLRAHVEAMRRGELAIPMVSTVTGTWTTLGQLDDPGYWAIHARRTVRFSDAVGVLLRERPGMVLIEVGPGETLSGLARRHPDATAETAVLASLPARGQEASDGLGTYRALADAWAGGVDLDWEVINGGRGRRIALPTYPFARDRYWIEDRTVARAASAAPSVVDVSVQEAADAPAEASDATAPMSRRDTIAQRITAILADQSGMDPVALAGTLTFTELGFDSLSLTQANSRIRREIGVRVTLGQLLGETPTIATLADHIDAQLPPEEDQRPAAQPAGSAADGLAGAAPSAPVKRIPLTDVQRDVWVLCQLSDAGSVAYDLSTSLRLRGELDIEALAAAVPLLVQRHEALRTTFDAEGEWQLVHPAAGIALQVVDLSDLPPADRDARLAQIQDAAVTTVYDLVNGPLFSATLVRTTATDHTLILATHHLISDGSSLGVLEQDLGALYTSLARGTSPTLDEPTQFEAYVAWRAEQEEASEAFWRGLYQDLPAQLDLPADRARPPVRSFAYGSRQMAIGPDLVGAVRGLAVDAGVTPFTVLLGAWELLLHRLSGQTDFASGVFVSGQASMGAPDLVGLCAGLLPLRVRVAPGDSVTDHLVRLKRSTFEAFDHQHYTVAKLASSLHVAREASRPTLVSTVMTFETRTPGIDFAGVEATESGSGRRRFGSFDFEAYLTETDDDLLVDFQWSEAVFEAPTIERWLRHYVQILRQMTARPAAPVGDLQILTESEREELLTRWNDTAAPVPDNATHERFEVIAARDPDRVAVTASGGTLTYGELNTRANRLARHLRSLGVDTDRFVGVHVHRSPDMVVALLAVLKAGGAYVPLDPLFPSERLAMIAEDAGLRVLITHESLIGEVPAPGAVVVALDRDAGLIDAHDASDLGIQVGPMDLAYAIYTSGSTGRPKGVEIPHVALGNLLESMRQRPGLQDSDALLAVTTMSFDIAGLELFLPLITGATIVLAGEEEAVDAVWLRERLGRGDITVMQATPATWQLLLDAGWTGTPGLKALCGGEALSAELAAGLGARVGSLWNMYGPTETTIWSSVAEVRPGDPITLGDPIANTQLHVLDAGLALQPLGVPGELYIGGIGQARGYHGREDLTSERFIEHRVGDVPAGRLYRTGDMVRRRADGRVEYLGRADFQVKIRGFRIELGEIETVLGRHPDVRECAVAAREGDGHVKRLVAYVVPVDGRRMDVTELRGYLRETLPDYMVPAVFVELDVFPMTANRKVDRARLPDPGGQRPDLAIEYVGPRDRTEATLAGIWEEFLGLERVGIDDNFFDLGGDSLLALRCIMRANREGISLTPNSIFRHQTIAELALASVAEAASAMGGDDPTGPVPLTPAQLRFLTERHTPDPQQWNVSTLVQTERLSPSALQAAVTAVVRHHDALRLRLWRDQGAWHQEIVSPADRVAVETHDLSGLTDAERTAAIERVCGRLQESFDLGEGSLIRVAHFRGGAGSSDHVFVTIHHFAVDGLTFRVFWEDLEQAYRQAASGADIALPPKTTAFRSWVLELERLARSPRVADTTSAWLRLPWHEVAPLPTDLSTDRARNTNASAAAVDVELGTDDTRRLLGGRRRPEHVIMAALAHVLSDWTASPTVLVDVLSHGRDAAADGVNLSRTVGFMLSYNPVVMRRAAWRGSPEDLDDVIAQIEGMPEGFTFELSRFLGPDEALRDRLTALPRADVLFNYAGVAASLEGDAAWREVDGPTGQEESPRGLRQYPLAVRATLTPELRLTFVYSTELHHASTIRARAAEVAAMVRKLSAGSMVTS